MDIILDTNILIELERKNRKIEKELDLIAKEYGDKIGITSPTVSEFVYGFLKSKKDRTVLTNVIEKYFLFNTSKSSSLILPEIKYLLESDGKTMSLFDLWIASIVIAEGSLLVTADNAFSNIPKLNCVVLTR